MGLLSIGAPVLEVNRERKAVPISQDGFLEFEFNRGLLLVLQLLQVSE